MCSFMNGILHSCYAYHLFEHPMLKLTIVQLLCLYGAEGQIRGGKYPLNGHIYFQCPPIEEQYL